MSGARSSWVGVIQTAIQNQQLLALSYDDLWRVVEPHAVGRASTGNELLRAYQVGGPHRSEKWHSWVLLNLEKVVDLHLMDDTFDQPREDYQRGDQVLAEIYSEL